MENATRYRLEKRIKELERQNGVLRDRCFAYETICIAIHGAVVEKIQEGKVLSQAWIVSQFRRAWK